MNLYLRDKQWATAANCSPRPTGTEASVPTFNKKDKAKYKNDYYEVQSKMH